MNRLSLLLIFCCVWAWNGNLGFAVEKNNDGAGTAYGQLEFKGPLAGDETDTDTSTQTADQQSSGGRRIQYIRKQIPPFTIPPYEGQRYKLEAPDTLDLADHCALAIKCLTGQTDPKLDYEIYFGGGGEHCFSDICGVKYQEALPLMRTASGSMLNFNVDQVWMRSQLKSIGQDGLYYIKRPWLPDENMLVWVRLVAGPGGIRPLRGNKLDFFMETVVQGRMLSVFTIYYLRDRNQMWVDLIKHTVDRLKELSIDKGDYAYLPVRAYEPGAVIPADMPPPVEMEATELAGRFVQSLAQFYNVTHYEPARELNRKYVNYLRYHAKYFDEEGRFVGANAQGKLDTEGQHFHAHALGILCILEHALATRDRDLIAYALKSFNWARTNTYSSLEMGWFPELVRKTRDWSEPCATADMVALAVKFSEAGIEDHWDDVDRWTRNQLVAAQTPDGGYGPGCCTGNATRALYYVWNSIIAKKGDELAVNLLMNRYSPELDALSSLPVEGHVEFHVKQPIKTFRIRVPEWLKSDDVSIKLIKKKNSSPNADCAFEPQGRYLKLTDVKPATYVMTFPVAEKTLKRTIGDHPFTLQMRGNTVVDLQPRSTVQYMPLYQRDNLKNPPVRYVTKECFAPVDPIQW